MKKFLYAFCLMYGLFALGLPINSMAPSFKMTDLNGKSVSLKDLKGNWVVLEWSNRGCPFVKKHYQTKNMQQLQSDYTKKGVKWLTIISSAKGNQGYIENKKEAKDYYQSVGAKSSHIFFEPDGKVARAYGAITTPHMFIIGPKGKIHYQGAIDSKDGTDHNEVKVATNYIREAFKQLFQKKTVAAPKTKPYGCTLKF